jgi:hypothetical protein
MLHEVAGLAFKILALQLYLSGAGSPFLSAREEASGKVEFFLDLPNLYKLWCDDRAARN